MTVIAGLAFLLQVGCQQDAEGTSIQGVGATSSTSNHVAVPAQDIDSYISGDGLPERGTVEWAAAFRDAREAVAEAPRDPEALLQAYGRLLSLADGCESCRHIYNQLGRALFEARAPRDLVDRVYLRAEDPSDPVALATKLYRARQPDEARRVAEEWLDRVPLIDDRCKLLQIIADTLPPGDAKRANKLRRESLDHMPAGDDYYKQLGAFLALDGNLPELPMQRIDDAVDWEAAAAELRSWRESHPGDACVASVINGVLNVIIEDVNIAHQSNQPYPEDIAAAFPTGPFAAQRELAQSIEDSRMRAAILLNSASVCLRSRPPQRGDAEQLLHEALAVDSSTPIQLGALTMLFLNFPMAEDADHVAEEIIRRFPSYQAACWVRKRDRQSQPIRTLEQLREHLATAAPCDGNRPSLSLLSGWQPGPERREALELLLDAGPTAPDVPKILLELSLESQDDPTRTDELEQDAIIHPEYPSLLLGGSGSARHAFAAERRGSFRLALFHAILASPEHLCGTFPGFTESCGRFIEAYYRVRCGLDTEEQWSEMLAAMPADPSAPFADRAHTTENLDRLVAAAEIVHREGELANWLRALQRRYEESARDDPAPDPTTRRVDHRRIGLIIGGYVLDLETASKAGASHGS